jgi:hypothetical protein
MNEFVVHSIPGSPFGRAVFVALEEKSVPYRLVPVAPGSLRQPEHLVIEGNTNLRDWLDRMNGRASMRATTWERIADMAKAA